MPNFCPRCFWIRTHVDKLPFQIFPGIFSSIDAYTKRMIHCHFDENKCFPSWLDSLGSLVTYKNPPSYTKFRITDNEHGITLWGVPDGIYVKVDGSHIIVDYKTSRYTGTQDSLMPMYEVQLNAYAVIGEQCGYKPISELALIYFEPITDADAVINKVNYRNDGFAMGFRSNIHKIKLNQNIISRLLKRAKEIYDLDKPPERFKGCTNCNSLDALLNVM